MPIGPGKYDEQCTATRKSANAEAAIVIIFNGKHGSGFSCQTVDLGILPALPAVLRQVADQIEANAPVSTPPLSPQHFERIKREVGELMPIAEFERRRADDPLYRDMTNLAVGHKTDCLFFRAVVCAVAIECKHDHDVCAECDPCTCGKGVSK